MAKAPKGTHEVRHGNMVYDVDDQNVIKSRTDLETGYSTRDAVNRFDSDEE
jgi:hypothetical protein